MENSTFSCYAFGKKVDVLVTPDAVYLSLAESPQERQARFIETISGPMDQEEETEIRKALRKQAYGSAAFLERMQELYGDRMRLRRVKPLEIHT